MRKDKAQYADLKVKAAILYIKHGLSAMQISEQIGVSTKALRVWRIAGKWDDYRPDTDKVNEYKAAHMYIEKGLTKTEIAIKLSVREDLINCWVLINGWDAARLLSQSHNKYKEIVNDFCSYYESLYPQNAPTVQIARMKYLRKKLKIIKQTDDTNALKSSNHIDSNL
ncbi:hypothetical protein J3L18_10775 [Mucilaginibacter gossypii]|uniref:hypothetical protein n=1 Tax=Mucilaginibacter gossypii TaxID=551996 RepID=UPI000DCAFD7F|nr:MULTISPECIES: hypothetical protein [Mucilaginibacter]QTE39510.1 hypothetical protein J3L18_10775 [Mucilaginibacter gossypii]RAV56129.1 hypothetical protein DIU36_15350 [Mucilaginibacter rubeus]